MNELDEYLAKKACNLRDLLKNEHMNDEYTRGWNEMKDQALHQCVIAGSPEAHARINSLKKPMNTPEVERRACWCNKCRKSWTEAEQMEFSLSHRCINPLLGKCSICNDCKAEPRLSHFGTYAEAYRHGKDVLAEPNWQELESALWAARSQTNEIANRGIDRVVSFFKKLHERTEPKFFKATPQFQDPPDLTEEELNEKDSKALFIRKDGTTFEQTVCGNPGRTGARGLMLAVFDRIAPGIYLEA